VTDTKKAELQVAIAERDAAMEQTTFHPANRRILAERVRKVKNGSARVLEIGSGHLDFTLRYLKPAAGEVFATDVEQLFPDGTPLPEGVTFQLEDALNLSFEDESFDCVIALEVIEHVESDDRLVAEALRVTRPGGQVIYTTPNRLRLTSLARYAIGRPIRFPYTYAVDPVLGDIHHLREYSFQDMKSLLDRHADLIAKANIEGIGLGVPAWNTVLMRSGPLHKLAFNWHVTLTRR
jgi:ubiquinone/menaquinone biosynthesis C-methylase UbiE